MSTDIIRYTPQEQVTLAADIWPLANRLANTEITPTKLRGKPETVMAVMLYGAELGMQLMESLNEIYVVEGRPCLSAKRMRKLVLDAGHQLIVEESSSVRCVMVGIRKGTDREQRFARTIEDARTAGVLGKDNWKKYPADMLLARASSALCRAVFADALGPAQYSKEELEDGGDLDQFSGVIDVEEAAAPKPATAKARRGAATRGAAATTPDAPAEERDRPRGEVPPLPGEEDIVDAEVLDESAAGADFDALRRGHQPEEGLDADVPADDFPPFADPDPSVADPGDPPSGSTMSGPSRIAMLMNQHGVADRAGKQRAVHQIIGRQIESTKELSVDETQSVILFMNALGDGVPFPFDDVAEGLVSSPTAELGASTPAPPPPQPVAPGRMPEEWSGDEWRAYFKRFKPPIKTTDALPAARKILAERGLSGSIPTLDDIAGKGIGDDLMGWAEDTAAARS